MRATTACRKEEENKVKGKEGVPSSAPNVVEKELPKWKAEGKDDCPPKKVSVSLEDKLPKKSSPPKPSHEASKGIMTTSNSIIQGPNRHLLTHKDTAVEVLFTDQ